MGAVIFFTGIALLATGFIGAKVTTPEDFTPPGWTIACWTGGIIAMALGGLIWAM